MAQPVKQPININFASGLNQKADPYQVPVGNFLSLVNTVFDKVGRLTKRNGFPLLATLPDTSTAYLTTYNGDLQAVGNNLLSYSPAQPSWVTKGSIYPLELSTQALVRNAITQTQVDSVLAPNGLRLAAYSETNGSAVDYSYVITDSGTGQNILGPVALSGASASYGAPRTFLCGNFFVILYTKGSGPYVLSYVAIAYQNPSAAPITNTLSSSYAAATTGAFDAVSFNNSLYIAYNGAGGTGMQYLSLSPQLTASSTFTADAGSTAAPCPSW